MVFVAGQRVKAADLNALTPDSTFEAEYYASAGQSIPNGVDRPLGFDTTVRSSSYVSRGTSTAGSISNAKYTLNLSGLWTIDIGLRYGAAAGNQVSGVFLAPDTGLAVRYTGNIVTHTTAGAIELTASCTRRFTAGDTVCAYAVHTAAAALSTQALNQSNHIRLVWVRP